MCVYYWLMTACLHLGDCTKKVRWSGSGIWLLVCAAEVPIIAFELGAFYNLWERQT